MHRQRARTHTLAKMDDGLSFNLIPFGALVVLVAHTVFTVQNERTKARPAKGIYCFLPELGVRGYDSNN